MKCILCDKNKNGLKLYNKNPLCDECFEIQKKLVSDFSKNKKVFNPECVEILKDKLYLGNYDFALNNELLKEKNISCILVCGSELECRFPHEFKYLKINLNDYIEDSIIPYIDKCIKFINDSQNNKIFVHCNAGISRSPSIIIAYLIKELNFSFKDALNFVKEKRYIKPNEKFIKELQNLEIKES